MNFVVRNQAGVANKYIRFAKWKIRKLSDKFHNLIYSEIYIKRVGSGPDLYAVTVKLGVPGPDIVVSAESDNLKTLWKQLTAKMKRQLRKLNSKKD
jgi:ribosome-associated translation inhibitor RaiA